MVDREATIEKQRNQAARARASLAKKRGEWKKAIRGKLSDGGDNDQVISLEAKGDNKDIEDKLKNPSVSKDQLPFSEKLGLLKRDIEKLMDQKKGLVDRYNSLFDSYEKIEAEISELNQISSDILEDNGDPSELIKESRKRYQELTKSLLEAEVEIRDLDSKIERIEDKIKKLEDEKATLLKSVISNAKSRLEDIVYGASRQGEILAREIDQGIREFDETIGAYISEAGEGGFILFRNYRNLVWNGQEQNPFKKLGSIRIKWEGGFIYW